MKELNAGVSSWSAMNELAYESDGDHEFRSPNGLDLDTSSEEVGPFARLRS